MNLARKAILISCFVSLSQFAAAQEPDVIQLLKDVGARYAFLRNYSDVGDVLVSSSASGSSGSSAAGSFQTRTSFAIRLARPHMYKIAWEQKAGFFDASGVVRSDGDSTFLTMQGRTTTPENTELALAGATGVSSGAAGTVPHIFFDLPGNSITAMENAALIGQESIEGDDCYVVKSHSDKLDRTIWISRTSKLIRQVRTDSSGNFELPEINFADMTRALEATGQKATDEAVQAMIDMMASQAKLQKTMGAPSISMIETHLQIQTEMPMSPVDFR